MTYTTNLQRSIFTAIAAIAIALAIATSAAASDTRVPTDVVVVSSTQLGNGTFTMTATNLRGRSVDLDLAAPGNVSEVSTDLGSFDGRWIIGGLDAGATATMTGLLSQ